MPTLALDLDGTLIAEVTPFASGHEPRGWVARLGAFESLRLGTRQLVLEARRRGWRVVVYTTSMRSPLSVRATFLAHGLWLDGVINGQRHRDEEQRQRASWPVKYPPAFGVELLVDDSLSLEQQGRAMGFRVVWVQVTQTDWVTRVLRRMDATGSVEGAS